MTVATTVAPEFERALAENARYAASSIAPPFRSRRDAASPCSLAWMRG
jgi:hypothetical protein